MDTQHAITAFAALAQERRLKAFQLLVQAAPGGLLAGDIARALGCPHNTLSTHLAALRRAGLVHADKRGREVEYRVDLTGVRDLVSFLVDDCCGGLPDICEPLATAAKISCA